MLATDVIRFVHVLIAISLTGVTVITAFAGNAIIRHSEQKRKQGALFLFFFCGIALALLTGCLLVPLVHTSFHLAWTRVALFATLFCFLPAALAFSPVTWIPAWLQRVSCFLLLLVLLAVIHDAVKKPVMPLLQHLFSGLFA